MSEWEDNERASYTPLGQRVVTSSASLSSTTNPINSLLSTYLSSLTTPLNVQVAYSDDFSNGFQGWQYQHDSGNPSKAGVTLSTEARMGNYSLETHTAATASANAWLRKGMSLPSNLKKVIFGCYWMMHAVNANNPADVAFDLDTQIGDGSGTGTNRYFFSVRYLNYSGSLLQKWQVNTGTATSQSFTDISGGSMPISWNEGMKPMLNYIVMAVDYQTKKYDKLYANGNVYDLSGMSGPTASASLSNFDMGLVNILRIENRSDAANEGILRMERPFLAWGF